MAHRGMKKLRDVEKIGLVVLCVLMLGTLGIGMGPALKGCGESQAQGRFKVGGDAVVIERADFLEYRGYRLFQDNVLGMYGFSVPPPWKFAPMFDPKFRGYQTDAKDLWTFIVLDRVAEHAGIEISEAAVKDWLTGHFRFLDPETRTFSRERYNAFLQQTVGTWATAGEFEKLVGRYLRVQYLLTNYAPLRNPTPDEVYAQWKNTNQRHDFRYVVQPVGTLRLGIDPTGFSADEVEEFYAQDSVRKDFKIPTKWKLKTAYLFPMRMTDEQFDAVRKRAADDGIAEVTADEARQYYYANEAMYSKTELRERLKKEWEEARAKEEEETPPTDGGGEAGSEEDAGAGGDAGSDEGGSGAENPGGEDGDGEPAGDEPAVDDGPAPADPPATGEDAPAADEEPTPAAGEGTPAAGEPEPPAEEPTFEDPLKDMPEIEIYQKYFRKRVEREFVTQEILKRLLMDERIHREGVEAVAKKWGLSYWANEEPVDQIGLLKSDPIRGQDLREAVVTFGAEQVGEYCESPVRVSSAERGERGWCFFRVQDVEKEHYPELDQALPVDILRAAVWNAGRGLEWAEIEELAPGEILTRAFPDADIEKKDSYTTDEVIRLLLRQGKAEDAAVARLSELEEKVVGGRQSLDPAAKEMGYEVKDVLGATLQTRVPEPTEPDEGEELTEAEKERNRDLEARRFLLKGGMPRSERNFTRIERTAAQSFVDDMLTDKQTDAAYLVYVLSHRIPGPEEMPEVDANQLRQEIVKSRGLPTLREFFSFDRLAERYDLVVPGVTDQEEEPAGP